MNDSDSSSRHYRTLNISSPCTWNQVKKQYRKLANTWHPDRLQDSPEKLVAEDKLKEINLAYNYFSSYFKEHGTLPTFNQDRQKTEEKDFIQPDSEDLTSQVSANERGVVSDNDSAGTNENFRRGKTLFLLAIIAFLGWIYVNHVDNAQEFEYSSELQSEPVNNLPDNTSDPENTNKITRDAKKYFSYGSTFGQVHDSQGTPSRTDGDTWFYGKSKINFTNGKVVSWKSTIENPLNVLTDNLRINGTDYFVIGSTKNKVRRIQGEPSHQSVDTWDYGLSRVYFFDDKVVNWHNSPQNPLKARK